jgi:hypothetical protein
LNRGVVEEGTYKNASLGIEFMPPASLRLQEPQMKGSPDAAQLFISVVADAGSPLPAVAFGAERLEFYPPGKRSASDHLQRFVRAQKAKGCQSTLAPSTKQFEGIAFLRADCAGGNGYESILVATKSGLAFVLMFEARDREEADRLVDSTKVVVKH